MHSSIYTANFLQNMNGTYFSHVEYCTHLGLPRHQPFTRRPCRLSAPEPNDCNVFSSFLISCKFCSGTVIPCRTHRTRSFNSPRLFSIEMDNKIAQALYQLRPNSSWVITNWSRARGLRKENSITLQLQFDKIVMSEDLPRVR